VAYCAACILAAAATAAAAVYLQATMTTGEGLGAATDTSAATAARGSVSAALALVSYHDCLQAPAAMLTAELMTRSTSAGGVLFGADMSA
jgi:hypothetical protein